MTEYFEPSDLPAEIYVLYKSITVQRTFTNVLQNANYPIKITENFRCARRRVLYATMIIPAHVVVGELRLGRFDCMYVCLPVCLSTDGSPHQFAWSFKFDHNAKYTNKPGISKYYPNPNPDPNFMTLWRLLIFAFSDIEVKLRVVYYSVFHHRMPCCWGDGLQSHIGLFLWLCF